MLVSLLDGPKHGHAIKGDIRAISGRALGPGTLYGAIDRLEAAKLIKRLPGDQRRKPYELTDAGRAVARAELEAVRLLASEGQRRLGTAPA